MAVFSAIVRLYSSLWHDPWPVVEATEEEKDDDAESRMVSRVQGWSIGVAVDGGQTRAQKIRGTQRNAAQEIV